jgi:hypothetical protein
MEAEARDASTIAVVRVTADAQRQSLACDLAIGPYTLSQQSSVRFWEGYMQPQLVSVPASPYPITRRKATRAVRRFNNASNIHFIHENHTYMTIHPTPYIALSTSPFTKYQSALRSANS